MPNTTIISTAVHLAIILLNPIKNEPAISKQDIHNPALVAINHPLKKSKKANAENSFPISAMKMKEAWLCHLPIEYSSSYKPSLFSCDSSSCSITNIIITIETGWLLPCGHAYYNICFSQNGSKFLHCLNYIKDDIDKHVQSLLDNDYDNTKKSADGISAPWDNTISRFLLL
ncbi:15669_t:CDS:2 [Funneliformis caledonium]|uniref:15669_t:CDS:1 n=1 Tax=Funneliformis caledonium TaxID=1117310 RepID=A0A9N9DI46_9GLOM|nr:15669_t:CDS:2 [Funneliformis caledonium]